MEPNVFFFFWGIAVGMLISVIASYIINKNKILITKDKMNEFAIKMQKMGSISHKIQVSEELSKEQARLITQLSLPSKNSSHDSYKREILEEVKEIEKTKMAIFKTIVEDGFDPMVKVYDGNSPNQTKEITMSEAVLRYEANQKTTKESTQTDSNPQRGNHLRLVKGEQSNDTNSTTIH